MANVCANNAIRPGAAIVKPIKITVKLVYDRRTTGHHPDHQVNVHAKMTLTVISPRFNPVPVGRTAKTGGCISMSGRTVSSLPAEPVSIHPTDYRRYAKIWLTIRYGYYIALMPLLRCKLPALMSHTKRPDQLNRPITAMICALR